MSEEKVSSTRKRETKELVYVAVAMVAASAAFGFVIGYLAAQRGPRKAVCRDNRAFAIYCRGGWAGFVFQSQGERAFRGKSSAVFKRFLFCDEPIWRPRVLGVSKKTPTDD